MIFLSLNLKPGQALILSHLTVNSVSLLPVLPSTLSSPCHSSDDSETQIWSVSYLPLLSCPGPRGGVWFYLHDFQCPFPPGTDVPPSHVTKETLANFLLILRHSTMFSHGTYLTLLPSRPSSDVTTSVKPLCPYFLLLRGLNLALCTSLPSHPVV